MWAEIDWQERSCEDTALTLVSAYELPIVLCRGERPIIGYWDRHTYSLDEIEYEFERHPDLNVGLILGRRSGLMEVVTTNGDGMRSEDDYYELVSDMLMHTPTFTSRTNHHRIFKLDERLMALGEEELSFRSVSIRMHLWGHYSLLPPSITQGVSREWRLHLDDCGSQFGELPHFAIDKVLASYEKQQAARKMAGVSLS